MFRINPCTSYSRDFETWEQAMEVARDLLKNPQDYFPEESKEAKGLHGYARPEDLIQDFS